MTDEAYKLKVIELVARWWSEAEISHLMGKPLDYSLEQARRAHWDELSSKAELLLSLGGIDNPQ